MDITQKQKKILLWGALGVVAVALVLTMTPLGNFFQSNLIGTNYVTRDAGLYLGKEETLTAGKALRAGTGATLKSENALKEGKYLLVDVYANLTTGQANTLATAFTYNPNLVSLETGFVVPTLSTTMVDSTITKVEKDSSGKETGRGYVMVRKSENIQKPSEKLFSLRFTVKDTAKQGEVELDTVRLVDSANAIEASADRMIVKGETQGSTSVPLILSTSGNRIESASTVDSVTGKKTEQTIIYNAAGQKIQETVIIYLANGKKEKETITNYNPTNGEVTSTEVWEYSYRSDGSYVVVKTTTLANGTKTVVTYQYKADGTLQGTSQTGYNVAFTRASDDGKAKADLPAESLTADVQVSVFPINNSLVGANGNIPMIGKPYRVNAFVTGTEARVLTSLKPFTVTLSKETSQNGNPYFYDESTNQWVKYPTTASTATSVTLRTSTFGIYALFADGTDPLRPSASTGTTMTGTTMTGTTIPTTPVTTAPICEPSDPFVDMGGHWSAVYVEEARLKCIVGGKFAGRFAPNDFVTRAELTKMAVEAFKLANVKSSAETGFLDVKIADWFANYVATARKSNIVQGYADATYRPNAYINRAEALKIILEAEKIAQKSSTDFNGRLDAWKRQFPTYTFVQFRDTAIGEWFAKYVLYAWQNDIVEGYKDGANVLFKPGQNITRAEVVKIIMEMVQ